MRYFAFFLSWIFPGGGHIWMGFCQKGVMLFTLFIFFLNSAFLASIAWFDPSTQIYLFWGSLGIAFFLWGYNVKDMWHIVFFRHSRKWQIYVEERLKRSILFYLKNDYFQAIRNLKKVLKKDKYHQDAYFYMGLIHWRQNKEKEALPYFKKCLILDHEEKWKSAIRDLYERKNPSTVSEKTSEKNVEK